MHSKTHPPSMCLSEEGGTRLAFLGKSTNIQIKKCFSVGNLLIKFGTVVPASGVTCLRGHLYMVL